MTLVISVKYHKGHKPHSRPVDKAKGVLCDQVIMLKNHYATKDYPAKLRRIKFRDEESGQVLIFLTNNFHLKATEVAQLYKHRWKIVSPQARSNGLNSI
ncbi:MAG: hypothetical protein ICV66_14110 [Chitinophagaceae bacterium]|nr:hypothetical protein [Chitinophagaceae bacterium]